MRFLVFFFFFLIALANFSQITRINTDSRDGKVYKTVVIGTQTWMAEDIKVIKYNNGDPIFHAKSEEEWNYYGNKQIGCFYKLNNGTIFYNGYVLNDPRGILPFGYKLPSYSDFEQLFEYLGGGSSMNGTSTLSLVLYPIYIEEWVGDQENGGLEMVEVQTNGNSGFNAEMGGYIYENGSNLEYFTMDAKNCSYWWTSSLENDKRIGVDIGYCSQDLGGGKVTYSLAFGLAVRANKK